MAKAKKVAPNTKEKDTREFFEALALMGQEKGIPLDYLVERIKTAIAPPAAKKVLWRSTPRPCAFM